MKNVFDHGTFASSMPMDPTLTSLRTEGINPHLPFRNRKQTETSCTIQISDLAFTQPFVQVNIITEPKRGTKEQILNFSLNGQNNQQTAGDEWVSTVAVLFMSLLTRHKGWGDLDLGARLSDVAGQTR